MFSNNIRIMRPIAYIRKEIFRTTQSNFAVLAGVTQGTVSRWELGELVPSQQDLARIREAALVLGIDWSDTSFFTVPPANPTYEPEVIQ